MIARTLSRVIGLALIGILALPISAAAFGSRVATWLLCALAFGPLLLVCVAGCLAFALSLILYGEPDRLLDRLLRS